MKTKSQWVVESQTKTRYGWASYFKSNQEEMAKAIYELRRNDPHFTSVKIYKETWKVA